MTATIGRSMLGNCVIGMVAKPNRPSASRMTNRMSEGIGVRIDQAETLRRIDRRPRQRPAAAATCVRTASPGRKNEPARATTTSPSASPSTISTKAPVVRPVLTLRSATRPVGDDHDARLSVVAVEKGRQRAARGRVAGRPPACRGRRRRYARPGQDRARRAPCRGASAGRLPDRQRGHVPLT